MSGHRTRPRRWHVLAQKLAASRVGAWAFSHVLHHVDLFLMRMTGGRVSIPSVLAGLPVVRLTTTGAKSGKERTVPVLALRDGDEWVVIASNWGGDRHPAWYHNLKANPEVTVTHDDLTGRYVAREVDGEEREGYWEWANEVYVGFEAYQRRADTRRIPVIVLLPTEQEPAEESGAPDRVR